MESKNAIDRRRFLTGLLHAVGLFCLSSCDRLSRAPWFQSVLGSAEKLNQKTGRWISSRRAMAQEYTEKDISADFRGNGTTDPDNEEYQALAESGFADWRLQVQGLVETPLTFSLSELRELPARSQITRHDCVEGWSAIGQWKGVPLSEILHRVRPLSTARFVVFHCADAIEEGQPYYESIDFEEAFHPQTILAYELNHSPLPVKNGAPLRLRVERQLGYKHAKYIMRIELVESFAGIGGGKGGYWEDNGYEWYAGI